MENVCEKRKYNGKKEKMLVASILFFSMLFSEALIPLLKNSLVLTTLRKSPLENNVKKEKMLLTSNTSIISFSYNVSYPFREIIWATSNLSVICKFFQFGLVWNIVMWQRVKFGISWQSVLSLSKSTILDSTKLKAFADDNFKLDDNGAKSSTNG